MSTLGQPPPPGNPSDAGVLEVAKEKRSFYRRPDIVADYDEQRFGGASGQYVNARETALVCDLLPSGGVVADVGSGTGRVSRILRERGDIALDFDTSFAMLRLTQVAGIPSVEADAFGLPILTGACDGAVALRLLFHFPDVRPLLKELRRIVRPGGVLVCDTYTWSPRSVLPLAGQRWGAGVSRISKEEFSTISGGLGWRLEKSVPCFLVSPYLYRRVPLSLARGLQRMERRVPAAWLCRVFWRLCAE